MDALLSIKPEYVNRILLNQKKFEYRKRVFAQAVERIYIYETHPTKKIVGFFYNKGTIQGTPDEVWGRTEDFSGIEYDKYMAYFSDRTAAYALIIGEFIKFTNPVNPHEIFEQFTPPQSFMYIREGAGYEKLRRMV